MGTLKNNILTPPIEYTLNYGVNKHLASRNESSLSFALVQDKILFKMLKRYLDMSVYEL